MATGRAGFFKAKTQAEEAAELQKQAGKSGLWGSIGGMLGSIALTPFLGPGASVLAKSLVSGLGSTLGQLGGQKAAGGVKEDGLWFKGQKEQANQNMLDQAITGGMTSGLMAGVTPWLKGGMEGGFKGLVKGGEIGAEGTAQAGKLLPGTQGTGKFFDFQKPGWFSGDKAVDGATVNGGPKVDVKVDDPYIPPPGEDGSGALIKETSSIEDQLLKGWNLEQDNNYFEDDTNFYG